MSSVSIERAKELYGRRTETETLRNMAKATGCRRVYKYKGRGPGAYTDYKRITEPGGREEEAMFANPLSVLDPVLVYDDGRVLNVAVEDSPASPAAPCRNAEGRIGFWQRLFGGSRNNQRKHLEYDDIRDPLFEALRRGDGKIWSAYQVCKEIKQAAPEWWKRIVDAHPAVTGSSTPSRETDIPYSVEVFILRALEHFSQQEKHLVMTGEFSPFGGTPSDVQPGATDSGSRITVWSWRPGFNKTVR